MKEMLATNTVKNGGVSEGKATYTVKNGGVSEGKAAYTAENGNVGKVQSTQSLVITFPKKEDLQQCQNYRTISLISHPSKVMLKIILNKLNPQAEKIIAEKQAGFRAGRSITKQIFNQRILY